jgi:ADP-ribose pyrophosphatase
MKERKPKVLASDMPFKGKRLEVVRETISWGRKKALVETIEHPGAVAILAVTPGGKVLLERQYRHSVKEYLYEIPAGTLEAGEDPSDCAFRELLEETGFRASSLKEVGAVYPGPGYSSEVLHLFVARVREEGGQRLEEDESISISLHEPAEALRLVKKCKVFDAKSALMLEMALLHPSLLH